MKQKRLFNDRLQKRLTTLLATMLVYSALDKSPDILIPTHLQDRYHNVFKQSKRDPSARM